MKSKQDDHYRYYHTIQKVGTNKWRVGLQPVKNGQKAAIEWLPKLFDDLGKAVEDRDLRNKSLRNEGRLSPDVTISEER